MHQKREPRKLIELCMVSNFVEVFLAREGHENPVGINFLEKVQMPHLASIYGAMLAGVGYVLMGAGIPLHIPGVLDAFAAHHPAEYRLAVTGAAQGQFAESTLACVSIPPNTPKARCRCCTGRDFWPSSLPTHWPPPCCAAPTAAWTGLSLKAPRQAATMRLRAASCNSTPPGEPVYGERDRVNIADLRALGVPFWLAGGYGSARKAARGSRPGRSRRAGGHRVCVQP